MPKLVTRTVLAIILPFLSIIDALYFSFSFIVWFWLFFLKPKYIVLDEKIARDSDWSWTDYAPRNFIVKDDRIHVIDLDSYGYIKFEDRQRKWDESYGIFAPLIRSYRGVNQIDAKLSCNNLDYVRLKKLLVNVFNARVERVEEDYFAKIDNTTYNNLEELMNYLRLLYSYLQDEMNQNPPRHQQRKNILRELR